MKMKVKFFAEESEQASGGAVVSDTASPAAESDAVDWNQFDGEDIEGEFAVVNGGEQKEPAELPLPPSTPEDVTAPGQTEQVPAETKQKTELPQQPPAQEQPEVTFDWSKWEEDSISALTSEYTFTEEEASQMLTEPELVLPKVMAKLHTKVIQNVLAHLPQVLPPLIESVNTTSKAESDLRSKFFSLNDDLVDAKFADAIVQSGKLFRSLNPTADADTAAFQVGNMVRLSLGMALREKGGASPAAQSADAGQRAPGRVAPFTPANGGPGGTVAPVPLNEFEAFAQEILDQDS